MPCAYACFRLLQKAQSFTSTMMARELVAVSIFPLRVTRSKLDHCAGIRYRFGAGRFFGNVSEPVLNHAVLQT